MGSEEYTPVAVSRRIGASAEEIFGILADPGRHPAVDGSGMLRQGASNRVVCGIGDVFVMKMYHPQAGDYETDNHVVAYELNRRIAWEPVRHGVARAADDPDRNGSRWIFDLVPDGPDATIVTESYDCSDSPDRIRAATQNGNNWLAGMTKTLELIDQLCAKDAGYLSGD